MRTLVISDLHLGMRHQRDVLRRRAPLDTLLDALADVDRLVLLGDVVELSDHNPEDALAVAAPVLRALGRRLGPNREVILVPGNHDRRFVAPWIQAMGARLSVDSSVPLNATPELAAVSAWLAPAQVSARYPGVWLADRVWATHGHYLNRDLGPAWSRPNECWRPRPISPTRSRATVVPRAQRFSGLEGPWRRRAPPETSAAAAAPRCRRAAALIAPRGRGFGASRRSGTSLIDGG
jgi:hypothetical protein